MGGVYFPWFHSWALWFFYIWGFYRLSFPVGEVSFPSDTVTDQDQWGLVRNFELAGFIIEDETSDMFAREGFGTSGGRARNKRGGRKDERSKVSVGALP